MQKWEKENPGKEIDPTLELKFLRQAGLNDREEEKNNIN